MINLISGTVPTFGKANDVIGKLLDDGYKIEDISVILKATGEAATMKDVTTYVGSITGANAGLKPVYIVSIGDVYIGGPVSSMLGVPENEETDIIGPLAGGFVNAGMGMGLEEADAQRYEKNLQDGKVVLGIHVNASNENNAKEILMLNDGSNMISVSSEQG